MPNSSQHKRLGFFTRVLDDETPAERYRLAAEQIVHAENHGFDSAWIAQHHFNYGEGGLPAPLVFLSNIAARTSTIRLGTGIITLPLEEPVRVAEDAAVLDLLSGGRLELGLGSGGTASSFPAFGHESADRGAIFERHMQVLRTAFAGEALTGGSILHPAAPQLLDRFWQATFSVHGGLRAGRSGDGLMLSKTQPRPKETPDASLADLQHPIVDAYLEALPEGRTPRILGSRCLFVADSRAEALRHADIGLRRHVENLKSVGLSGSAPLADILRAFDVHIGTPADVIASLKADTTLERVTDIVFQVHSIDPPHALILRSIELIAAEVAPALGWVRADSPKPARLAAG